MKRRAARIFSSAGRLSCRPPEIVCQSCNLVVCRGNGSGENVCCADPIPLARFAGDKMRAHGTGYQHRKYLYLPYALP